MTIETLRQYRSLKREITQLDKAVDKMRDRMDQVRVVAGKVQASDPEYPYTRIHIPVEMYDPGETAVIRKRLAIKEKRLKKARALVVEIDTYIASIGDSENRQIFEMAFLEGMTYRDIGEKLHMDWSNVGKRIQKQLSTNSTK